MHDSYYSYKFTSYVSNIQGLHYYPFAVSLDRCTGSCNTLNDLSNWICFPNITEDINLNVFKMITGIDKSKVLIKHIHANVNM